MKTLGHGRKLTALIVDDQPSNFLQTQGNAAFAHLELEFIESWAEAQRRCAAVHDLGGADILLIDVSFERDASIDRVNERDVSFLPVGPLLALPYIGRRAIMSCVTYSAHMANPALQKHPYFLLAMGLILARSVGIPIGASALHSKHLSEGDGPKQLDKEVARLARSGFTQPFAALVQGLEEYRQNLECAIKRGDVTLVNHHSLTVGLSELRARIGGKEEPTTCEGLQLMLVGCNWTDAINLQSLFADRVSELGKWATEELISEMEQWVRDLGARSPTDWALEVIEHQDRAEEDGLPRPNVKQTVLKTVGDDASSDDLTSTLRLCLLFANVWAMEYPGKNGRPTRTSVLSRLGEKLDVNTYFGWFGKREKDGNSMMIADAPRIRGDVADTGSFKLLRPISSGIDKFSECFLSRESSTISQDDYRAIQQYRAYEEWPEWRVPPLQVITS